MKYEIKYEVDFSSRDPHDGVDELFYKRWSPRSLEKVAIPQDILNAIFDAARWSPSCSNEQPWLFITSSNADEFKTCLELLEERNQRWADKASVIGFIFGKRTFSRNAKINSYAAFDCGAACMAISLQAIRFGLYVHTLAGIHKEKVYEALKVPKEEYEAYCGFTIGALDLPDKLPQDLKAREKPPMRKSLQDIWKQGI